MSSNPSEKLPLPKESLIRLPSNRRVAIRKPQVRDGGLYTILNDIIPRNSDDKYPVSYPTQLLLDKIETFEEEVKRMIESEELVLDGIKVEILEPGKRWQSGTLKIQCKISVEFIPDEPEAMQPPESPLDEIRRQLNIINDENQT